MNAEAEITAAKFYKGSGESEVELKTADGFTSEAFANNLKTIKFVKASGSVAKTDGDDYTCKYTFSVGSTISATAKVAIHSEFDLSN